MSWGTRVGELVGKQLRFIGGALAFGHWQGSAMAGLFAYALLITLERGE